MTKNLTSGKPLRLIVLFTIPLFVGNIFQQLYGFADAFVVGRTLGIDALAAVGATGSISFLLLGFAIGTTAGFAIPTAQRFGGGDLAGLRRSVATGAVLTAGVAVVITAVAVPLTRPLLQLLQTPPEILDDAVTFLTVSFYGAGAILFFNFLSATIRALGDSRTPLIFLAVSCVLNVALVTVFLSVLHAGVGGAALATVVSQLFSVLLCLWLVARRMPMLHLTRADWRIGTSDLREHLRLGLPMGFQMSIIAIGALAVQFALNGLGATSVAAFTAAQRVDTMAVAPLASFGVAISTFAAQNQGAKAYDRIRRGIAQTCWLAVGFAVAVGIFNILAGAWLIKLFVGGSEPEVVQLGHAYLVVSGVLYAALALLFVLRGALQGLGHTLVPTLAGIMELFGRVGAAMLLTPIFGFAGVAFAAPFAWIAALVPLVHAYVRQRRELISAAAQSSQNEEFVTPGQKPATEAVAPLSGRPRMVLHHISRVPARVGRGMKRRDGHPAQRGPASRRRARLVRRG